MFEHEGNIGLVSVTGLPYLACLGCSRAGALVGKVVAAAGGSTREIVFKGNNGTIKGTIEGRDGDGNNVFFEVEAGCGDCRGVPETRAVYFQFEAGVMREEEPDRFNQVANGVEPLVVVAEE